MHLIGTVCTLTLSILTKGYQLEWDPTRGPAQPIRLHNHPSAIKQWDFVSGAVLTGVKSSIMQHCNRNDLLCVLLLGVATNSAGQTLAHLGREARE